MPKQNSVRVVLQDIKPGSQVLSVDLPNSTVKLKAKTIEYL